MNSELNTTNATLLDLFVDMLARVHGRFSPTNSTYLRRVHTSKHSGGVILAIFARQYQK